MIKRFTNVLLLNDNPSAYLDEIAITLGRRTGKYFRVCTIWRYVSKYLGYSLQTLASIAKQQSEIERNTFKNALEILLDGKPEMLIMVDETHKDRNAARRRKGWGKRNSGGVSLNAWYSAVPCFTMIGVADVNGFIDTACHTVMREALSAEGAAGTLDRNAFLDYVKTHLCPHLGRFKYQEPRSVVMLDNASTHMSTAVVEEIRATGAVVIFSAPYSPDLNPIENYFSIYKKYLKRNEKDMKLDWKRVHQKALLEVDRDNGIKYFRRCGIPGGYSILTREEQLQYDTYVMQWNLN